MYWCVAPRARRGAPVPSEQAGTRKHAARETERARHTHRARAHLSLEVAEDAGEALHELGAAVLRERVEVAREERLDDLFRVSLLVVVVVSLLLLRIVVVEDCW